MGSVLVFLDSLNFGFGLGLDLVFGNGIREAFQDWDGKRTNVLIVSHSPFHLTGHGVLIDDVPLHREIAVGSSA